MHMADALVSPAVGATMWTATAAATAYCARKVTRDDDPAKIPLMGVSGAFVFAAQMLNFTIPGTGSSGHLGGGLLLALLLGSEPAFLVMASVLAVQALFFADGGLLALGCNIFNLGFIPAFIAYPLVYRPIAGNVRKRTRLVAGSMLAAVLALQLGSLGVVAQTTLSGISALPFSAFAALMQPIHLVIGLVEGAVTVAVALFVMQAQPRLLAQNAAKESLAGMRLKPVLIGLGVAALIAAAGLSWFASSNPDGLEWSIARITGSSEAQGGGPVHDLLARLQDKTAVAPDYSFKSDAPPTRTPRTPADTRTAISGLAGTAIVLAIVACTGWLLKRKGKARREG